MTGSWSLIKDINSMVEIIIAKMTAADIELIYSPIFKQNDRKLLVRLPSVLTRLVEDSKYAEIIFSILLESAPLLESIDPIVIWDISTRNVLLVVKYIQPMIELVTKLYAEKEGNKSYSSARNQIY